MKAEQLRELSDEELRQKEEELTAQLFKLRFQVAIGQLENPQKLKLTRRDIARIQTIKREREINKKSEAQKPKETEKGITKKKK